VGTVELKCVGEVWQIIVNLFVSSQCSVQNDIFEIPNTSPCPPSSGYAKVGGNCTGGAVTVS
jgi:hypothetical protein